MSRFWDEPSPSDWEAWAAGILAALLAGNFDTNVPGDVARSLGFAGSLAFKRGNREQFDNVMEAWREGRDQTTRSYVRTTLKRNVEQAMQAVPVLSSKGEETGEYRYDGAVANRALELLGKQAGMFGEQVAVQVTGAGGGAIQMVSLLAIARESIAQDALEGGVPALGEGDEKRDEMARETLARIKGEAA